MNKYKSVSVQIYSCLIPMTSLYCTCFLIYLFSLTFLFDFPLFALLSHFH